MTSSHNNILKFWKGAEDITVVIYHKCTQGHTCLLYGENVPYTKKFLGMGGASGVAGGAAPCALCPAPGCPSPVVVRKNYMCPLDPSRPLSQPKVYVKIHEMCCRSFERIQYSLGSSPPPVISRHLEYSTDNGDARCRSSSCL